MLNGDMIIGEMRDSESVLYYYDAEGKAVGYGIKKNAETAYTNYYLLRNAQNDILEIYDSKSVKVGSYTYDTWGKPVAITPSQSYANAESILKANPFRYRGYYYDEETKLYYLNSRYYDPEVGRFINADGYVSTGKGALAKNIYAYCENNPVNKEDPSGKIGEAISMLMKICIVSAIILKNNRIENYKKEFVIDTYVKACFIELYTDVPASIVTAQACIESAYGKKIPIDKFSGKNSNNIFGIKAYGSTPYVTCNTREVVNGENIYIDARFAAYDSVIESFFDYELLLVQKYKPYVHDNSAVGWANALQSQGYATDPNYADTIVSVINYWGLM